MSFINFCKTNLGFVKLTVLSQLEYRFNFFMDAIFQPLLFAIVEALFWSGIFQFSKDSNLQGFGRDSYLAYAIAVPFFTRVSANWMYEMRMAYEVESGRLNTILARPVSFYTVYFSQFMAYKFLVIFASLATPFAVLHFMGINFFIERIPLAVALLSVHLILVYNISYLISGVAFFLSRTEGLTTAKNMFVWVLAGEILPVDILPSPIREWVLHLPFAAGGFLPVAYIIGRVDISALHFGFVSNLIFILITGFLGKALWRRGLQIYSGTGA